MNRRTILPSDVSALFLPLFASRSTFLKEIPYVPMLYTRYLIRPRTFPGLCYRSGGCCNFIMDAYLG